MRLHRVAVGLALAYPLFHFFIPAVWAQSTTDSATDSATAHPDPHHHGGITGKHCEEGRRDRSDVPGARQSMKDLKSPAAVLEILPAGSSGEHNH